VKQPRLQDDAFLADVRSVPREAGRLDCWWLGQSGFLLHNVGTWLLVDPYLSDSLTHKYAATDKPHVRMTARVVDPARLDFIHVVTSSHAHTDHLDAETLRPLLAAARENLAALVAPTAIRALAAERSGAADALLRTLDAGESIMVAGVAITAVPAEHNTVERDESGHHHFLGYVFRLGPWTIYHSGDTKRYDGLAERLRPFAPDLAILPINGDRPERRVAGNLSGTEAAQLARDVDAGIVVPCHYDMFTFNTADPADEFIPTCERLGQAYRVLENGARLTLRKETPR
jgi:L-ascorbate metabolism protein UlaG (beta-lactamase superfamily)